MSTNCLACRNGDEPSAHRCIQCKKAVHIIEGGCSLPVDSDEGYHCKRICLDCHSESEKQKESNQDKFLVVFSEDGHDIPFRRIIPLKWADELLEEFDYPLQKTDQKDVVTLNIDKVLKRHYTIEKYFGPFDTYDAAEECLKTKAYTHDDAATKKWLEKLCKDKGWDSDLADDDPEANCNLDCRKEQQVKNKISIETGKFVVAVFKDDDGVAFKEIVAAAWVNSEENKLLFPKRSFNSSNALKIKVNKTNAYQYDLETFYGPFKSFKEGQNFLRILSSAESSAENTDNIDDIVKKKIQEKESAANIRKKNSTKNDDYVYDHGKGKRILQKDNELNSDVPAKKSRLSTFGKNDEDVDEVEVESEEDCNKGDPKKKVLKKSNKKPNIQLESSDESSNDDFQAEQFQLVDDQESLPKRTSKQEAQKSSENVSTSKSRQECRNTPSGSSRVRVASDDSKEQNARKEKFVKGQKIIINKLNLLQQAIKDRNTVITANNFDRLPNFKLRTLQSVNSFNALLKSDPVAKEQLKLKCSQEGGTTLAKMIRACLRMIFTKEIIENNFS